MVFSSRPFKWIKKTSVSRKIVSTMSRFLEVSICKAAAYWRQLFFYISWSPDTGSAWRKSSVSVRCSLLKLVHVILMFYLHGTVKSMASENPLRAVSMYEGAFPPCLG